MNRNSAPKDVKPSTWSLRLLKFFINKDYLEEIEGDMEEVFEDNLEMHSHAKAKRLYALEVLKLIRPNLVKRLSGGQKLNYLGMLQHHLLITFRGFKRHRTTFFINLIGLSTGLACAILIFLWVQDERSVDTFHEKNDRLYWVMANIDFNDETQTWDYTTGRLAKGLSEDFPEVEESVRVGNGFFRPRGSVAFDDNYFEVNGLFASPNFFQVLTYDILLGNPSSVLKDKGSVVITEQLATSIFGSKEKAIGQSIKWENRFFNKEFIVSGIFEAPPSNASKHFNIVLSYDNLIDHDPWADRWNGGYSQTYVVLKEGIKLDEFNSKIANYLDDKVDGFKYTLFAQQYSKNYLYGEFTDGIQTGGRIENVRLFTFIGLFILAIACINFMNLSTAQASKKMKEVGVKKTIGANRSSLIFQFLNESICLALLALVVSVTIVVLVLPVFNEIASKSLSLELQNYWLPLIALVVITGIFAGSYPAFYLSRFKPVSVLKGQAMNFNGEEVIRKGLVIFQFALSVIFIIGVFAINMQIEFTQSKPLGYDRESVITFRERGSKHIDPKTFFNELSKLPGVISSGNMNGDFLSGDDSNDGFDWIEGTEDDEKHLFYSPRVGYDFIETLGLEIIEGRSFSRDFNDGIGKVIVNEAAVAYMGLEDPIGRKLERHKEEKLEIIGVLKDFQYGSLHQKIEPMIIRFRKGGKQYFVRLKPGLETETIKKVETVFKELHPGQVFNASLLSEDYIALYDTENKVAELSGYMASVAIIISCLGLFGLAAFTAERRTKEIGIRKILGAKALNIIGLLSRSFSKTVLISIIIALPVAYYLVHQWLQNFAYAINLDWTIFAYSSISVLLIAWLTVGFQTIKASMINPVQCLRNE